MCEKFEAELGRLHHLKDIVPVDEPTKWVSQLVLAVTKTGELRICVDPKSLNATFERDRKSTRLNSSHTARSRMPSSA